MLELNFVSPGMCPIASVEARDGALFVTFHVSEIDEIRTILTEVRSQYAGMSVVRIIRSETEQNESTLVHVDRDMFTDRQSEVLETALERGYFEHSKEANGVRSPTASTSTGPNTSP